MAELLGFHHVALTVRDRDLSADWYAKVLGFDELFREDSDERRAAVMRFPGGAYGIGVVEHLGADHAAAEHGATDGNALALFWDRP